MSVNYDTNPFSQAKRVQPTLSAEVLAPRGWEEPVLLKTFDIISWDILGIGRWLL